MSEHWSLWQDWGRRGLALSRARWRVSLRALNTPPDLPRDLLPRLLRCAFIFAIVGFAWWRFSDNTADNDLWGHVLYGQRMLALGRIETHDPFSWTASHAPWLNHEVFAEIALGWVHLKAGSTGLWLLTVAIAAATITLVLREARRGQSGSGFFLVSFGLFAVSTNSLALGFSARPQLFTLLALAVLLGLLRRLQEGNRLALAAIPFLFFAWMNTHGGVLAGLVIVGIAAAIAVLQGATADAPLHRFFAIPATGTRLRLGSALLLALAGMLLVPHGLEMFRWLVGSVAYVRPEITEWRATPLDAAHATFFFVALLSFAAWIASRRARPAWEAAVLAVLLFMACRHQRHIPLFCLANLMFTPPHLHDALQRLRPRAANLVALFGRTGPRLVATAALFVAGGVAIAKSVSSPRESPWRIEVERDFFPCAALEFLRDNPLEGNLLVFFDWGQHAMWELPRNRVSFDGRLDTVYPRRVIEAHWRFYRGSPAGVGDPDLRSADFALLPRRSGGAGVLLMAGWKLVYSDPLALVLVREPRRHPSLEAFTHPVQRGLEAVQGREPFPEVPSALARPNRDATK